MVVLSLFDGISVGQLALNQLGITYNYIASEIDKEALSVTKQHFPNTIQIGDVTTYSLKKIPKIDLLIGGSPCQGFSNAGNKRNFNDPRSKLFFEFLKYLEYCKPKYFLLENVPMKKQWLDIISSYMGIEPVMINSSHFSKQNRQRFYWTNIPLNIIIDKNLLFSQYLFRLGHGFVEPKMGFYKKYPCLTAVNPGSKYRLVINLKKAKQVALDRLNKEFTRQLSPDECERLQTLPIGYTQVLNKTNRYKVIGNAWTLEVIKYIFSYFTPKQVEMF